ncbi:hypothetical protein M758_1G064100 [Ceratodon purpureus]|nr:hypothetical protein M758_1G064100 [Ceratodon purpureus]
MNSCRASTLCMCLTTTSVSRSYREIIIQPPNTGSNRYQSIFLRGINDFQQPQLASHSLNQSQNSTSRHFQQTISHRPNSSSKQPIHNHANKEETTKKARTATPPKPRTRHKQKNSPLRHHTRQKDETNTSNSHHQRSPQLN